MSRKLVVIACALAASGVALAKLPAPDDAAKAKAAETAARSAWQTRVDAFQLCRVQDRVASHYRKTAATSSAAGGAAPTATAAGGAAPTAGAAPGAPGGFVVSPTPAAPAGASPVPASAPPVAAAALGGTAAPAAPVAVATAGASGAAPMTPCADPGPFAYTPPDQKPLEVSGAHSPTGTAVSPPSTNTPAAAINPGKK